MAATFGHDRPELDLKGWPGGERLYQEATSVQMHIKLERCQRDSVKTQIKFRQDFWLSCMDNSCIIFTLNDYEPENTLLWIWGLTSSQNQKCESDGGQSLFCLLLSLSLIWKQTCTYTQHHCFLTFPSSEIIPCLNYYKKAVGLSRVLGHLPHPKLCWSHLALPISNTTCVCPPDDPQNEL